MTIFDQIVGRLERWLLFNKTIRYRLINEFWNDIDIKKRLHKEGFFEDDSGVDIVFTTWEDVDRYRDINIKIVCHSVQPYISYYLGMDVISSKNFQVNFENLPSVSIITPVYNSEKFFEQYLNSISKLVYPKDLLEIIIIDDGSDDKVAVSKFTKEVGKYFPTKLFRNSENRGIFFAKMRGVQKSNSDFITFWDIDDKYDPYQIFLLATHDILLREANFKDFLITGSDVIIYENSDIPQNVWKTPPENPLSLVLKGVITFTGRIQITSYLLKRERVLETYKTLLNMGILKLMPKLSAYEDTILAHQMVFMGYIKLIFPVSYTGRGRLRGSQNVSGNLKRRAEEAPLSTVLGLIQLEKIFGVGTLISILEENRNIIRDYISIYEKKGDVVGILHDRFYEFAKYFNLDTRILNFFKRNILS